MIRLIPKARGATFLATHTRDLWTVHRPILQARGQHSKAKRQQSLPAAYYRGGSSRAIFFHKQDLPEDIKKWDNIFLGAIGSPDPYGRQLDGMGGGISSLSKVCVIGPSNHPEADVDYTFVSIGIKDGKIDYSSNCGNMSAAVGPYAIDTALVQPQEQTPGFTVVRIHNTNTKKIIHASFPIDEDGCAAASGSLEIDGVAGAAAPINLEFINPAGSRTGKLLPTGNSVDTFDGVQATCIDASNPCCFVMASELNVPGDLSSDQIEANGDLKAKLESIRRQAAVKMGLAETTDNVPGSVPKISVVSPAKDASTTNIVVRAMSVGQAHKAIPVTVALATAAAAKIPGSTVAQCFPGEGVGEGELMVWHASGTLKVDSKFGSSGDLLSASVFRTARRLMDGNVYWK